MRQSLFGAALAKDVELGDLDGMQKLQRNTSNLTQGLDILDNAIQTATDTEETANGTAEELERHRDVLHKIGQHVFIPSTPFIYTVHLSISNYSLRIVILTEISDKVPVSYDECRLERNKMRSF